MIPHEDELHPETLSTRTKFVYGLGDWGTSAATAARNLYWLFFLVSVVGLKAELAGTVILVGRIWDSINDPLIGMISDKVDTRWGRRRPFLLFGAVPFGFSFLFLFVVPPFESEIVLSIYYGAMYLLFDTMYTIINVPYSALTPELTEDYDERSSLAGWRIATAILASLIAAGTFKLLAEDIIGVWLAESLGIATSLRVGYAVSAIIWAASLTLSPLILFKNIEEPKRVPADSDPIQPFKTFKEVFSNRPFRLAATVYLLSFSTGDIVVTVFVWFLVFYVGVSRGFDSLVMALVLGLAFLTMPLTVRLMRKFGKRKTFIGAMTLYAFVLLIMSQIPRGGQVYVLVAGLFAGFGYGAVNVIPWAMVADVIETDELKSGKRREGAYSGYLVFFRKMATAVAIFVVTWILSATGFQGGTTGGLVSIEQPDSALLALRFLVGVLPALMLVLAILAAWRYPLDRETHREIRRQLARQRAKAAESLEAGDVGG